MEDFLALIMSNKEWLFSGIGIFVVTAISGTFSVLGTLWIKNRNQNKQRKKLHITSKLVKFDLPSNNNGIDNSNLSVSYKSHQYKHLNYYSIVASNMGEIAIENQKLFFNIPEKANVVEESIQPSNSLITVVKEDDLSNSDVVYSIDRLEKGEEVSITYLIDLDATEKLKFIPRGVDNIDYNHDKSQVASNDLEHLIILLALFIFAGTAPMLGGMLQGAILLFSSPTLVRFIRSRLTNSSEPAKYIQISGDINVDKNGNFIIDQKM
ncbi:hypothetical protein AB6C51_23120 [Vibrio splendidus]